MQLTQLYKYGKSVGVPSVGFRKIDSPTILQFANGEYVGHRICDSLILPWVGRTSGIKPRLLADSADYLVGSGERAIAHRQLMREVGAGLIADWLETSPNLPEGEVYTFEVDGVLLAQEARIIRFWTELLFASASQVYCTVLGRMMPQTSFAGAKIRNVPGAHQAGASLFVASDGTRGLTPISTEAAEVIAETLNRMLVDEQRRLRLGRVVYLFWSDPDQPEIWEPLLKPVENMPDSAKPGMSGMFHAIALQCPDQGNVAIVDQIVIPIEEVIRNLERWEADSFAPTEFGDVNGLLTPLWALANAVSNQEIFSRDAISLVRAALMGEQLPDSILMQANEAIRRSKGVNHEQAQVLTAALTRQQRWKQKTGFESSDRRRGYRAGFNAARRGRMTLPEDLDSKGEWGEWYRKGFLRRLSLS